MVALHDGDTVTLDIDLGFDHLISGVDWEGKTRLACRVFGMNAPELSTAEGKVAHAYAETLLKAGDVVGVTSHGWDKYGGRFDGAITLPGGEDFAESMISAGHAKAWDGTGAKPT